MHKMCHNNEFIDQEHLTETCLGINLNCVTRKDATTVVDTLKISGLKQIPRKCPGFYCLKAMRKIITQICRVQQLTRTLRPADYSFILNLAGNNSSSSYSTNPDYNSNTNKKPKNRTSCMVQTSTNWAKDFAHTRIDLPSY